MEPLRLSYKKGLFRYHRTSGATKFFWRPVLVGAVASPIEILNLKTMYLLNIILLGILIQTL